MKIIIDDSLDALAHIGYYRNKTFVQHNINNLPSRIWLDHYKEYRRHGKLHREDGPAISGPSSYSYNEHFEFYLNDTHYSPEAYWKKVDEINNR